MFDPAQYQLIDFGDGRKLERFGDFVLDRPAPAADGLRRATSQPWSAATARYERTSGERGRWLPPDALPASWTIEHRGLRFELKPTEFGHLGIFAEQAENWNWISEQVGSAKRTLKVLNLFAYTGGSTLAAAAAGAEVVHIDAAQNTVAWARRNAELSGLPTAPIRWIAEDALKFVERELKRGNRYDAVILDPPSYGHGPRGEVWKLADGLPALLSGCARLTEPDRAFMLLTCHTPGIGAAEARSLLAEALGSRPAAIEAGDLALLSAAGGRLPCGVLARWPA